MNSMEGHMDMGPHMKMTALRQARPGDVDRAQAGGRAARKASAKYTDYHAALADGFKIFHPEMSAEDVPLHQLTDTERKRHFSSIRSIPRRCCTKSTATITNLIGVMYTAPKRFTEDQLDERIPLSVAQWHEHVNFCAAAG